MRALAVVPHEERTAPLQPAVEVHDRSAPTVPAGNDSIGRLQNETALTAHERIVPQVSSKRRHCPKKSAGGQIDQYVGGINRDCSAFSTSMCAG